MDEKRRGNFSMNWTVEESETLTNVANIFCNFSSDVEDIENMYSEQVHCCLCLPSTFHPPTRGGKEKLKMFFYVSDMKKGFRIMPARLFLMLQLMDFFSHFHFLLFTQLQKFPPTPPFHLSLNHFSERRQTFLFSE